MSWCISNKIVLAVLAATAGIFLWTHFFGNDFNLPFDGETVRTTSTVSDEEGTGDEPLSENSGEDAEDKKTTEKEILVTDGVKHTIPLDEILQGCPGKDCIPSIDSPKFESIASADDWLDDEAPGIAFSRGHTARFYPYDILVSHELVNDTLEDERVLISYCPLCLTAVVFDPLVEGERVEFGVSGLLWESNLIMYDRKTDTLWSQVLGEAIAGELTGMVLQKLASDQVLYGNWKKTNPQGEVLAREFLRGSKGGNPYADTHFDVSGTALHFAEPSDTRLPFGAQVFGITVKGKPKAYHIDAVKMVNIVRDTFEGTTIELRYNEDLDVVRMFELLPDGSEKRINPLSGFWFSWAEAHPDTELYK